MVMMYLQQVLMEKANGHDVLTVSFMHTQSTMCNGWIEVSLQKEDNQKINVWWRNRMCV